MNLNPRHTQLLDEARQQGLLNMETLAACFGVTLQTVRYEVKAARTLLEQPHGAWLAVMPAHVPPTPQERKPR